MKYAAAAIAFAGLAVAQNATVPAPPATMSTSTTVVDVYTTLTICDYSTVTVYDCPPEIVDCPADKKTPSMKENYVPVTTTVCPVASVPAIVAALPPTQKVYPAPAPAATAAIVAPGAATTVYGYPGPVSPVAPVPVSAGSATNTPAVPTASVQPYTGAATIVSGSIGAVVVGIMAVLAF